MRVGVKGWWSKGELELRGVGVKASWSKGELE
jgi:hypothetical protein